ncbi:MAG: ribosome small subunit-dependent GTPase A [Eubacteriales bacterium]|nr:ribosome small subunit-dependent GTPase A [Eubacteriales bacterium]
MILQERAGVIVKAMGGLYYARDEAGDVHVVRAKGVFRRKGITPLVGDAVRFAPGSGEEHGWIEQVLPRENELVRPPVANIRHLFIVLAPEPEPDRLLIDTLLVTAHMQRISPVLVVNKRELDPSLAVEIREEYARADAPVLEVSAQTGYGLDQLAAALKDGIGCMTGQSGVGKSTLLNKVTGLTLEAGDISSKIGRGKNTTHHTELLVKDGYQVLDTAGFSLLELLEPMNPVLLKAYYPDFAPYEDDCHFQPCYHFSEPGCAVLTAAARGELSKARLERYHQLLDKVKQTWRNRYE